MRSRNVSPAEHAELQDVAMLSAVPGEEDCLPSSPPPPAPPPPSPTAPTYHDDGPIAVGAGVVIGESISCSHTGSSSGGGGNVLTLSKHKSNSREADGECKRDKVVLYLDDYDIIRVEDIVARPCPPSPATEASRVKWRWRARLLFVLVLMAAIGISIIFGAYAYRVNKALSKYTTIGCFYYYYYHYYYYYITEISIIICLPHTCYVYTIASTCSYLLW